MAEETLIQKIRSLPPERVAEVEDFVDFLTVRDQDRHFTQVVTRLSEEAFRTVWTLWSARNASDVRAKVGARVWRDDWSSWR